MLHRVHTAANRVDICVARGTKSAHDFIIKYVEPGRRARTPRHAQLVVELCVKQAHDRILTHALRDHLLHVYDRVVPMAAFPPSLQVFHPSDIVRFRALDAAGEFSVEFLLVISELIFIRHRSRHRSVG